MENLEWKQTKIKEKKKNVNKRRTCRIKWTNGKLIKWSKEIIAILGSKKYLKRLK